jgi:signal transduction histidine kinase
MFKTARIQLTARYLIIIMAISIAFSIVIFKGATQEIDRIEQIQQTRFERRIQDEEFIPPEIRAELHLSSYQDTLLEEETKQRILIFLGLINLGILIVSGGLGYYLAGKTLSPIQAMMDDQNRFISDASHELRTPLTALKTMMEVSLRDKNLTLAQAKELISDNITEVDKLHLLSDHLLALAQYKKTSGNASFTKVDFTQTVEHAIKKMQLLAQTKEIKIVSKLSNQLSVNGDPYALERLCMIILDNAVKYSPEKETITLILNRSHKQVVFLVSDHGIGIAENDIPHIFNRFFRTSTARTKTGEGGFGLGLAIAQEIVKMHSGTIELQSILNKGTTVRVTIPCFS